jgi:hypothetical protein
MNKLFLIKQLYVASDMYDRCQRFEQAMYEEGKHDKVYPEYIFQQEEEWTNQAVDIFMAGDKNPLIDFCQKNKHKDTPLGDLCGDILRDEEIMAYTNIFACMAKLIGMSDELHLKKPIKQLFDKLPEAVNNFYK